MYMYTSHIRLQSPIAMTSGQLGERFKVDTTSRARSVPLVLCLSAARSLPRPTPPSVGLPTRDRNL